MGDPSSRWGGTRDDSFCFLRREGIRERAQPAPLSPPVTNKHYVIPNEVRDLHPLKRILAANLNDMDEKFG